MAALGCCSLLSCNFPQYSHTSSREFSTKHRATTLHPQIAVPLSTLRARQAARRNPFTITTLASKTRTWTNHNPSHSIRIAPQPAYHCYQPRFAFAVCLCVCGVYTIACLRLLERRRRRHGSIAHRACTHRTAIVFDLFLCGPKPRAIIFVRVLAYHRAHTHTHIRSRAPRTFVRRRRTHSIAAPAAFTARPLGRHVTCHAITRPLRTRPTNTHTRTQNGSGQCNP